MAEGARKWCERGNRIDTSFNPEGGEWRGGWEGRGFGAGPPRGGEEGGEGALETQGQKKESRCTD